jgi:hypothetical protein
MTTMLAGLCQSCGGVKHHVVTKVQLAKTLNAKGVDLDLDLDLMAETDREELESGEYDDALRLASVLDSCTCEAPKHRSLCPDCLAKEELAGDAESLLERHKAWGIGPTGGAS